MEVHFLGGADEVGASCVLVEAAGRRVLVDAGVRMGAGRPDRLPDLARASDLGGIDAVLVTHAHLDHSGALPLVHGAYPRAPVVATAPTLALLQVLLLDALKVMGSKAEQEDEIPLYPRPAVEALLARAKGVRFLEPEPLCGGELRATFFPAGHVLGAAAIGLETPEGSVLITGDVSVSDQLTVPGMPRPAFEPDLLVCESTYGARLHASRRAEEARLTEAVTDVLRSGGTVLIPAFALGRAQEVLLILRRALAADDAPPATVYADGMVRAVAAIYGQHRDALSPRLRERVDAHRELFYTADGRIRPVASPQEREALLGRGPAVIVASSGMLAGGPSQQYAAQLAPGEANLIALTGYQDEEAPGRKLLELASGASRELPLGREAVEVRCRVETFGLSAHADAQELAGLVTALRPGAVALVHGDDEARRGLANALVDRGVADLSLPTAGASITVGRARRAPRRAVAGVGRGRPLDLDALAELHGLLAREGRAVSARDLAERWHGTAAVPVDLTPVRALLDSGQPYFTADGKRPFLYRRVDLREQPPAAASSAGAPRDEAGRLEQNAALALVGELLGSESGLYRKGASRETWTLRLAFDFPDVAARRHAAALAELEARSGWAVEVSPEPNLALLSERALAAVDPRPTRAPSVLKDERRVRVKAAALPSTEALAEAARRFEEETGYGLVVELAAGTPGAREVFDAAGRMEINLAFAEIDRAFDGLPHRPHRKSKRADAGGPVIELAFVTPEVGARYSDAIAEVERRTGWRVHVGAAVDQQAVLAAVRELIPPGWAVRKGPGLDVAGRVVTLRLAAPPPSDERERFERALEERTGFGLALR